LIAADTVPVRLGPGVSDASYRRRGFGKILGETFRIYWSRFFSFVGLALIVTLPSVCGQLATAWIKTASNASPLDLRTIVASAFAFCMLVVSIVLWPVYIAGIQILAGQTFAGDRIGLIAALNEAVKYWPRVFVLWIFVFVVFGLLTLFAIVVALMILAGGSSPLVILFALGLLTLQVWLFGRFFINVLFWQQFAVLENAGVADSLRESRALARSGHELPWHQRPLWRGAFIVSIWIAFVLALTVSTQWQTIREYWNYTLTIQDPHLLLEKMSAAEQAHTFDFLSLGLGVLQKLLQPLLGIAFVVLYFDSKKSDE
jgi:hypothetical protein